MPTAPNQTRALEELLTSTLALLAQFNSTLTLSPEATTKSSDNGTAVIATSAPPPDPLAILRDAASLLKAHTTKLSLLAINTPFTPSALVTVLRDATRTCLPAMLSAVQLCQQQQAQFWGATMAGEIRQDVCTAFTEFSALLDEIRGVIPTAATGPTPAAKENSLRATGRVWDACDALVTLEQQGIAGRTVRMAQQFRDLFQDAIAELQEWRDGEGEDEGRDALLDSDDEGVAGDSEQAALDDIFRAASSNLPSDRPELATLVDTAIAKVKKIALLYAAVIKRRLATFPKRKVPPDEGGHGGEERAQVMNLDALVALLRQLPRLVDDLAASFYDLDEAGAREALLLCVDEAKKAVELVRRSWTGQEDEFTKWTAKWEEAMQ